MFKKSKYKMLGTDSSSKDDEGNWLYSYADLMSLLFLFFVIIASFSTPDPLKFEKMKAQTSSSMGVQYVNPFNQLSDKLKDVLKTKNLSDEMKIEILTDGIRLTGESKQFFGSGSAVIKEDAVSLLTELGKVLAIEAAGYNIEVQGHTDDTPINTQQFPSNWELSLRRSSEVVRLLEKLGVNHFDLRPVGLADTDQAVEVTPELSASEKETRRALNRRIVIRLQKKVSPNKPNTHK